MSESEEIVHTLRLSSDKKCVRHRLSDLTLPQAQQFADEFGLGRIVRMEEPLTTQCNVTDPFKTGQGTFILRVRHGEEFGARVEFLHRVMGHLRQDGVPVPEVMRIPDGRSWMLWGERIVEIHRFVNHDLGVHRDWQRMYAAASVLGDLHNSLARLPFSVPPVAPEMRNDLSPVECWKLSAHVEKDLQAIDGRDEERDEALKILEKLREALLPLMDDYERIAGTLPWGFVHGDYHFWNLLYRGDEIVGVVDFDFLQERERLFDVAYGMQAMLSYFNYIESQQTRVYARMKWGNVRMWVDHFDAVVEQPLVACERSRLPKECLRVFLVNIIVGASQEKPIEGLTAAGSVLPFYQWIASQPDLFFHA